MCKFRVITFCIFMTVALIIAAALDNSGRTVHSESNNSDSFPSVHINTNLPISRDFWNDASVTLSNTDEHFMFFAERGRIRGRGNSSWDMEKAPFRIRFNRPQTMLDSNHAAQDWTFIPNHSDKSLLRNYSAYFLASKLDGMDFAPFARFVDVYFNGEYQGVYMLCIQVEAGDGRAVLEYNSDPALSEYLIEMNHRINFEPDSVEGVTFVTVNERHYDILYPRSPHLHAGHVRYIRNFLTTVDDLIHAHDDSVFDFTDINSFVDFYIVQELYKNLDVGYASVFMQIKGSENERKLYMGPVWDFDISAGNAYFQGRHSEDDIYPYEYGYSPHGLWVAWTNRWFTNLMMMPEFFDAVTARWNEIVDYQIRETIEHIEFTALTYEEAFERNFERWHILGEEVWPNPQEVTEIDTFLGQVEYLVSWLEERIIGFTYFLNAE